MKKFQVYLPQEKQWVDVTEEQYYAYYRDIWATRKRAQAHGQCTCPKSMMWKCDGDCLVCKYHSTGDCFSLDYEYENGNNFLDTVEDTSADVESIVEDKVLLELLYKALKQIDPEGRRICELLLEDMSEREVADLLDIKYQSTLNYRKKKAVEKIKKLVL